MKPIKETNAQELFNAIKKGEYGAVPQRDLFRELVRYQLEIEKLKFKAEQELVKHKEKMLIDSDVDTNLLRELSKQLARSLDVEEIKSLIESVRTQ